AFGGQTPRDGAPDAGAAAGHQRDPARQLLLGGRQGELVELERPVLDVEGVLRRERDVLAERAGVAEHADRVVIDVVDDTGRSPVLAGGEHAEPGYEHDPRARVDQLSALEPVLLEVARVAGDEALDRSLDRPEQGWSIVAYVRVVVARKRHDVALMFGGRGTDLRDAGGVRRRHELRDRR